MSGKLDPAKNIGNHPALAHANVDAWRVKINWSKVEQSEGVYNWTAIDQAIALAGATNKKTSISINAGLGTECPEWLWADGAKKHTIQSGKYAGKIMPEIDDPVYIAKWTRFIAKFGTRYDANPHVGYVVMTGIGNVVEWYESDPSYFQAQSPPNPPGTAKWINQAKTFIDAYAAAFPTTPIFGALANPYGNANGLAAEKTVVDYAVGRYPGRFGIMTNTLSARSSISFYPISAIVDNKDTQPTGFQMLWSQTRDGGIRDGYDGVHKDPNALDESLTNGVNFGGRFVEVYEIDCNNTALQATITSHQTQLKALP
jgi:hypothetical protein